MTKITILGAGSMSAAFAYPCSDNKHDVSIVGTFLENDFIDELNKKHFHSGLNLNVLKTIKIRTPPCRPPSKPPERKKRSAAAPLRCRNQPLDVHQHLKPQTNQTLAFSQSI